MKFIVKIPNVDALTLRTKVLVAAAQRGLRESVPEAALLVETEAKALVPVDTGNLRDHIHSEQLVDEPEKQVWIVSPVVLADNKEGFDPPYARRIEFGFVGQDSLGRWYNQLAQPYMRPAAENKREECRQVIKEGVYAELDNAMVTRR